MWSDEAHDIKVKAFYFVPFVFLFYYSSWARAGLYHVPIFTSVLFVTVNE